MATLLASGCTCSKEEKGEGDAAPNVGSSTAPSKAAPSPPPFEAVLSLYESEASCQLWEQGLVLDLGSDVAEAMRDFELSPEPKAEFDGHLGESFRKLDQLHSDFTFWLPEDLERYAFQGLIHGRESDKMAVYIDGRRLGAARLKSDETRVVDIRGWGSLERGRHTLRISLSRERGSTPGADVSWVRLGEPGWRDEDQPATMRQVFSEVTIEDTRHRSIVLKPGGRVRCPLWVPEGARLLTKMGLWGSGAGEGEVAVLTRDEGRVILGGQRREKDEFRTFSDLGFELGKYSGQLVELEFVAHPVGDPARVAFATPTVVTPNHEEEHAPPAKRAVVVILGGLGQQHVPPLAVKHGLPFLNQLSKLAVSYPQYRSSSTSVPAVVASLLTAMHPVEHGVSRPTDRLSSRLRTLAGAIEASGGRSAFFTGVPSSFADFGFDRGFERFVAVYPQHDEPAEKPLLEAEAWLRGALGHEGPVLAVVHLRGAHPPFDISREDARKLPPDEYGGDLSPRRAAIQLGDIRSRRYAHHRRMPEEDWTRLVAMQKSALLKQDAALVRFVESLRKKDAFDDTLFIVMGDVAAGEPPLIPFDPDAPLDEEYLAPPLLIKYASEKRRGTVVEGLFAPRDISYTISESLGIDWLEQDEPIDLGDATATEHVRPRPHLAFRQQRYSLRMGGYLLKGQDGDSPELCLLEVDPSCSTNRAGDYPVPTRSLWRTAWSELSDGLDEAATPEQQEENEAFENALIVWGVAR